ncbi:scavenger receptor cysteine-rich type 1 protein M130-like [Boleophthalmus pectinirostris]|uniref:scavenger receptor cysteine-rich type 1 protein M130-like n=1 Tax=Boleophthalmus pectinirostris TaxID=150288 RepID=UPI00242D5505|nr:scavenger receptor cysteine-rich type 1 protein M130-like [Boleophthalmus pectinirostris]
MILGALVLVLTLHNSGVPAQNNSSTEPLRLVGGASRCAGTVEVKHKGEWRRMTHIYEDLMDQGLENAAVVCRDLNCGSVLHVDTRYGLPKSPAWDVSYCGWTSPVTRCLQDLGIITDEGLDVVCSDFVRLDSGPSPCSGSVQIWNQSWTSVCEGALDLQSAEVLCRELSCGVPFLFQGALSPLGQMFHCEGHESALMDCPRSHSSTCSSGATVNLTCSEPLRLVGGASRCAGTVEVKHRGEWRRVQSWASGSWIFYLACVDTWTVVLLFMDMTDIIFQKVLYSRQGLEVVCSGVPAQNNSSTELLRLVGGASRCAGTVEVKHKGEWRRMTNKYGYQMDQGLENAAVVCRDLNCGSVLHVDTRYGLPKSPAWDVSYCRWTSPVTRCLQDLGIITDEGLDVVCSDFVRLDSGPSPCSGSVQIWNQSWTSVCEGALDLQSAEVLCRELSCGVPFLFQGALSPLGQMFHCEGHESALMDCPRSHSRTCSSGATVNLTCSEPLRLVGGASRCAGTVEVKHRGEWRRVQSWGVWELDLLSGVCRHLDCGAPVYGYDRHHFPESPVWAVYCPCVRRIKSLVRECVLHELLADSRHGLEVVCSDSVRLDSGPSLCSGSVQIWDQSWTSVCEGALDLQSAEVLCRELDCGAPSLLQGALSPLGQMFHCEGHESALMDCPRSHSRTCSSGATVNLTCSEPLRLVGGASRCAGTVEVKHRGEWRRVFNEGDIWSLWGPQATAAVCRDLDCGSAVSGDIRDGFPQSLVWNIITDCVKTSAVRECVLGLWNFMDVDAINRSSSDSGLEVVCSDLLYRPNISLSVSDGESELQQQGVRVLLGSKFEVKCSVEPQYPGGSFQLLSPTAPLAQNHTLPAVNHSAYFLFSDTGPAHKGNYTCVYHLQVFNHSFSSQSPTLQLSLGARNSDLLIRVLVLLLLKLMYIPLYYYCKYYYCKYYYCQSHQGALE